MGVQRRSRLKRAALAAATLLGFVSGCRCEPDAPPPDLALSSDAEAQTDADFVADAGLADAGDDVDFDDYRDVPTLVPMESGEAGTPDEQASRAVELVTSRGLPNDYRRALGLATSAHDAGAKVDCRLFDLARDDRRLAQCYERGKQDVHLALLVASGRGAARDPDRAHAMLSISGRKDCTVDRALAAVNLRRRQAGGRALVFCGDAACTSTDIASCLADRILRYDWTSSSGRQVVHDRLDEPGRAAYRELSEAFAAYAQADASSFDAPGSVAALKRRLSHYRHFDALLERVSARRDFPHATDAELRALAERIASLDRDDEKHRAVAAAHTRYETLFAEVAKLAAPELGDADRRVRALVRKERLRVLSQKSATP